MTSPQFVYNVMHLFIQSMYLFQNRVLYSLISVKVKGSDEAVLKSYTEFIMKAAAPLKLDISGRYTVINHFIIFLSNNRGT